MRSKKFLLVLCLSLATSFMAFSQNVTGMVKDWERAKAYTKEYLDSMPATGYAFKPTPEMRSFAQQMLHLTDANYAFAAAATGTTTPLPLFSIEKTGPQSKDSVITTVLAGYDFVIAGIKKMKPAQFNEKIKVFDQFEMTRLQALEKNFEHQTHHRGQTTVYLRLVGVKPPQEKLF